jgi:hypothetical protein
MTLDEPRYRRTMREEREQADRPDAAELKRLRWHLVDQAAPTLRELADALRRPGEPVFVDPWLRRLNALMEAGEVRCLVDVFGVRHYLLARRVLTVDEMVPLGLARPEPPLPPALQPGQLAHPPAPLPRRGRYSDELFGKVIDRLARMEDLFGPTEADEVARHARIHARHIFAVLVEAEGLGLVRSARTALGALVWSLA